jgi:chromosome segregation ATPase
MRRLAEAPTRWVPAQISETTGAVGGLADNARAGEPIERSAEFHNEFGQRATLAGEVERARADVRTWQARARESERAREQIARRMDAARRDVYEANRRSEAAEARAVQAKVRAGEAEARATRAEAWATQAEACAAEAEAARDALLSSTAWRMTWPIRALGQRIPHRLRRVLRRLSGPRA